MQISPSAEASLVGSQPRRKRNVYGKPTYAKNGLLCRSAFEAEVFNKFLFETGLTVEYERKYPNSDRMCDFYIQEFELWIECVYHKARLGRAYECYEPTRRIIVSIAYHLRDIAKTNGARWDPKEGVWWTTNANPRAASLEAYFSSEAMKPTMISEGGMTREYDDDLYEKLIRKDVTILVVNKDDLSYSNLGHIMHAKMDWRVGRKVVDLALNFIKKHKLPDAT